ncbi:hypothetical protein QCA50_007732 [Cerrena zonata]|uniref:DUF6534 domain-containing protein n=1 Tax=Cerrena zonata TaxID=2478898 RepID=A0AAW0GHX3_9APHY
MPSIPYTVGGFVQGIAIANIFYGISIAQAYVYVQHWEHDPRWMKWLATIIILLETGNTVFLQRQQFFYSILSIGDPLLVAKIDWSMPVALLFEVASEIFVQTFYVHRMWMFSKNRILTFGTITLLISRHGFFLYCIADTIKLKTWTETELSKIFRSFFISTAALGILTDAIIATTMAYYLYRNQSQLKRTRGVVGWLIIYFVNTGALLVGFSACTIISYLAAPDSLLFGAFIMFYARAVANSLFGALNARHLLRAKIDKSVALSDFSNIPSRLLHSVPIHTRLETATVPKISPESSRVTFSSEAPARVSVQTVP